MRKDLAKNYDPKAMEDRIYSDWEMNKYFHAEPDDKRTPYTIVIPPPNITGQLHMGHAIDNTLQDILIRWKRMQGFNALWVPGTDHASIATEAKVVEALKKEGKTKDDLGRDGFLERVWEWRNQYGSRIVQQLKKLGSSCDWDRERFTMDEGLSKAVTEVFLRLHKKGLIYQGERIVNWCPHCQTSISDAEVEYEEQDGFFWHFKYPFADGTGYVEIATTRPETMLGDTAVAVNPDDERYKSIVGKNLILPLVNKEIPVVADDYVDKDFGTGCVKITPAHDPNDFGVGARHNLAVVRVMNDDGTMASNAGKYAGMDRYAARDAIVEDMKELGLLVKIEPHKHNVGTCYRCKTVIEPIVSKQWFVKMKPLAEPAIEAVRNGDTEFVPPRFAKTYFNWMENIQDWCISRQLWWGHRIPAYYCKDCGETVVASEMPEICPKCGSKSFAQDEDTLDTWFSSALWPFSTLGWPDDTKDLEYFYPTNTLVTGYDIIFFWVARMIFSGLEHMETTPFKHVFIHGLVRDEQGRKMSKSLGNGIDPLEVIDKYGADALRLSLVIGTTPGNDMRFTDRKVEAARNFANKVWNASRFVLMNFEDEIDFSKVDTNKYTIADKWIMSRANRLTREVTENMDKFELGVALQKIQDFVWNEYCDWYIEIVKPRLYDRTCENRLEAQYVLNYVLCMSLKLLHPFIPFVTTEIYSSLLNDGRNLMVSDWPVFDTANDYSDSEEKMEVLMNAVRTVRNARTEMDVPPSRKAKVIVVTDDVDVKTLFTDEAVLFERLAFASEVVVESDFANVDEKAVKLSFAGFDIAIPLEELIDFSKEIERLKKEKETLEGELKRVNGKLANKSFVDKAPEAVVNEEKAKKAKYEEMYNKVNERLASFD